MEFPLVNVVRCRRDNRRISVVAIDVTILTPGVHGPFGKEGFISASEPFDKVDSMLPAQLMQTRHVTALDGRAVGSRRIGLNAPLVTDRLAHQSGHFQDRLVDSRSDVNPVRWILKSNQMDDRIGQIVNKKKFSARPS